MAVLCPQPNTKRERTNNNSNNTSTSKWNTRSNQGKQITLLQTFTCNIRGTESSSDRSTVHGILNTGSQSSFIAEDLVSKLNFPITRQVILKCSRFQENTPTTQPASEITAILSNESGNSQNLSLYTTPHIVNQPTIGNISQIKNALPPYLNYADKDLFSTSKREIKLLIGADSYFNFINPAYSRLVRKGFALLNSTFGWIPTGSWEQSPDTATSTSAIAEGICAINSTQSIKSNTTPDENVITRLWDLETLGIESPEIHKDIDPSGQSIQRKHTYRFRR